MSLKKESRSNNNFFFLFSPRNRNYWSYMQKDKESNNSLFPILLFFFNLSQVHISGSSSTSVDLPPSPFLSFLFRIKCNNCVIIIVLIPSARPIVKICATFSIKITFLTGMDKPQVLLFSKEVKQTNEMEMAKTKQTKTKTKTTKKKNKTKQIQNRKLQMHV